MIASADNLVIPVFCFTQVSLGGFGFSPIQISGVLAASGVMQTLYALIAFPPLQHRFGTVGILRTSAFAWPFFFLIFPIANLLLRHNLITAFWVVISMGLIIGSAVSMAFSTFSSHSLPLC